MKYKFMGTRYERGLDVKDIAVLVRAEIKKAIQNGQLPKGAKVSVRISRYSMGQSLDAHIKHLGAERVINPAWLRWHDANPHGYFDDAPPRYTATASHAMKVIEGIIAAYNFDNSDSQTDYFHVNFHSDVSFDYERREAEEELIRRTGLCEDESAKAMEEAVEKGAAVTCTGDDDCPICQLLRTVAPTPKPIIAYPVFNQRQPYLC